jgi:hypothetical protein
MTLRALPISFFRIVTSATAPGNVVVMGGRARGTLVFVRAKERLVRAANAAMLGAGSTGRANMELTAEFDVGNAVNADGKANVESAFVAIMDTVFRGKRIFNGALKVEGHGPIISFNGD